MLRVAVPVALILLASGCLDAPAAVVPVDEAPIDDDDDVVVTATRVQPLVHTVDVRGRIENRLCGTDDACMSAVFSGMNVPVRDFADPAALFWRVSVVTDWQTSGVVSYLRMTVYATSPCGIACVDLREVAQFEEPGTVRPGTFDIYLEEGETGVRIQLEAVGNAETTVGEAGVDYHLHGTVNGYRPVAAPVIIG